MSNAHPLTQPLRPSDPATVFISYRRAEEAVVLPVERALLLRGVRVLRDKPSLPLGVGSVSGLTAMIDRRCDAILFAITPSLLASDFIWRYEVPAALARAERDPRFHIIPLLLGVTDIELTAACADRGLRPLSDFNGEFLGAGVPGPFDVRRIARRTLASALALRWARDPRAPTMAVRTFAYTPPSDVLHLDVDLTGAFAGDGPTSTEWSADILPALGDAGDVLAAAVPAGPLDVWLQARLPAALAFGYTFPAKGAFRLRLRPDGGVWCADGASPPAEDLRVLATLLDSAGRDAIVEVAVSRDVTPAVTRWAGGADVRPRWRVRCAPADGPLRDALRDDAQARSWARRIGDEVRRLWDREGVSDIHLFVAAPVAFAAMLGQQLRDRRRVHVYYGDNEAGYRLAVTLGGEPD